MQRLICRTGRERMLAALDHQPTDRPPHFESMFELEFEAFGMRFPDRRSWAGMDATTKDRAIAGCLDIYARVIEEFRWDALCVYWPWGDPDDSRLRDHLAGFLGEDPCATQSMFYFKPPGTRGQDMHQDDFYLRTAPGNCIAAWLAVDRVDDENGGLRVVAGSHRLPLLPTRQADLMTYFADDGVDVPPGMMVVAPELEPGDVLFFGGLVIHGSGPNRSRDRFRRSFICHYVGASTTHLNPWNRPVETFDRREIPVEAAPVGPWQSSFAGGSQRTAPH